MLTGDPLEFIAAESAAALTAALSLAASVAALLTPSSVAALFPGRAISSVVGFSALAFSFFSGCLHRLGVLLGLFRRCSSDYHLSHTLLHVAFTDYALLLAWQVKVRSPAAAGMLTLFPRLYHARQLVLVTEPEPLFALKFEG